MMFMDEYASRCLLNECKMDKQNVKYKCLYGNVLNECICIMDIYNGMNQCLETNGVMILNAVNMI